jgi:predicted small metal-binding protein
MVFLLPMTTASACQLAQAYAILRIFLLAMAQYNCRHVAADGDFQEDIMTRKYIDCREYPSEMNCSVALSADSDKELLEAAVQHAVAVHGHQDSPDLREKLSQVMKDVREGASQP